MTDLYSTVRQAVIDAPGISVNATLSSLDKGSLVLPPTYADAPHRHNMTEPNAENVAAWVSLDSPASFANRVEEKLVRAGLGLDPLRVQVAGTTLSTMQMPHRVYDAILRDSNLAGEPFPKTEIGKAVTAASARDASALLQYDPAVLLFGGWDSTRIGKKANDGNKWPAALSVEIHGENATLVKRAGNRVDPLRIEGDGQNLVEEADGTWRLVETEEDRALPAKSKATRDVFPRRVKPSELNHGNALSLEPKGVLVERIRLSGALSLTRLRRYAFGGESESDVNARTLLALMGLYGVAVAIEDGLALRRDCELVADEVSWTIRRTGMPEGQPLEVSVSEAQEALSQALAKVRIADPVVLTAGKNLEQLIARSR